MSVASWQLNMISTLLLFLTLTGPAAETAHTDVVVSVQPGHPNLDQPGLWLGTDGQPLRVLAVEEGPAEVVVVRDPAVQLYLDQMSRLFLEMKMTDISGHGKGDYFEPRRMTWDPLVLQDEEAFIAEGLESFEKKYWSPKEEHLRAVLDHLIDLAPLGQETRLRFVQPQAIPVSRTAGNSNIFAISEPFRADTLLDSSRVGTLALPYRFADAVLVAGNELHANGHRRAVVLFVEGFSDDVSYYSPEQVRKRLRQLQVPVVVWSLSEGPLEAWGTGQWITEAPLDETGYNDLGLFRRRVADLKNRLKRQRIVRLAGHHELGDVRLAEGTEGVSIVGREP